eukprot:249957-Chlamydomonas_euryale.AAC.3
MGQPTPRDATTCLQRKNSWLAEDVAAFAKLCTDEHSTDAQVRPALERSVRLSLRLCLRHACCNAGGGATSLNHVHANTPAWHDV